MSATTMCAMVFRGVGRPLVLEERPIPEPGPEEILVRVAACGVCRTDLHVVDGELAEPRLPLVPGHEVVGRVAALGAGVERFREGERIGVPWLGWTCGTCRFCQRGQENLCTAARFTGSTRDGGYGDYCVADQRYCLRLEGGRSEAESAPLLCAGLIGYRALRMAGDAERIGLYGFGAAGPISSLRWHDTRGAACSPSCDREMKWQSGSRSASGRTGPAIRTKRRPSSSTRHCCSRRSAHWCRRRLARSHREARWSARVST